MRDFKEQLSMNSDRPITEDPQRKEGAVSKKPLIELNPDPTVVQGSDLRKDEVNEETLVNDGVGPQPDEHVGNAQGGFKPIDPLKTSGPEHASNDRPEKEEN
jgi:hypothetical protein